MIHFMEDGRIEDVFNIFFFCYIKQIDSLLSCVCLAYVIKNKSQKNVKISVTHSAIAKCVTFLFLPHFDVIRDLLLHRRS